MERTGRTMLTPLEEDKSVSASSSFYTGKRFAASSGERGDRARRCARRNERLFAQPTKPLRQAITTRRRDLEDPQARIDLAGKVQAAGHVERHIRQQVDLVEDHQVAGPEH